MAETEIAGIIVPAVVTEDLVAKPVVDLLIEKYKAGKDSLSLADMHEVLNYGLERLLALRRDKEHEVLSHIEQKDPSGFYRIWKMHVSDIEKEMPSVNKIYEEEEEEEKEGRLFSKKRGILEENIKRALSEVIKLLGDEFPEEILVDLPSIAEYPTLQKAFQDIQTLLQSEGVKCVALDGQTGVMKTTIMKHLNNHFCGSVDFDVVIFIKLTADDEQTDLHILQKIAERIRVDRDGHESEVVGRIRKVLENKRYLLILDGVRNPFNGIWEMLDISNDENNSKVVITNDDDDDHILWRRGGRCVKRVKLGRLSRTEAWKMFQHTVGHDHLPPTAKPASPLEGESSSKSSTKAIGNPKKKQHLVQDVLRLMRIRDFVHLMLSYPMRIGYEKEFLKQWINAVYELSFADDLDIDSFWGRVDCLLYNESPLRHVQTVIPQDITTEIIKGGSVSRETALKHVPKPILLLATHLALHQLTFALTSHYSWLALKKIQTIWFSTRNDAEKRTVVEDVQANSQILAAFDDLQIIDLNQIDDQTKRELVLMELTTNDRRRWLLRGHLVLVVDGDGDKKLDPVRVSLPMNDSGNVVVFITTLSSNDYLTSKLDLTIKTEDHLLPWELFCNIVGSELLHSSIAIQEIAVQIVEKCRGHLLAVILMAKPLKHVTDVQLWELALQKLLYRDREAIVNALIFNIIWANEMSEREKARLIRCLMVFRFLDYWKMSKDQLFACWFSQQLVDMKEEATSILQNFMECSVLLQCEDTQGWHILLPEDIKVIFHSISEEIPENLSEGALVSTIPNLQVLNLSYTHMRYLYDVTTDPRLKELNLSGLSLETLPRAIFKLQTLEILCLKGCSQLQELPPQIAELGNLKQLWLTGCERLETLPQVIWELQNLEVCDLSGTQIIYLPLFLNFPKLRRLSLENNLSLMKIPTSFFDHVPQLNFLNLSRTSIHELPSSIFKLEKLRELHLKECALFVELSPKLGQLTNLTTLDLDGTLITHLPKEIGKLINLESLSLSFCNDGDPNSRFDVIPNGVLTQFTNLKVLRIDVNSDNEWWLKNFEPVLAQISTFKKLRELDVYIPRVKFQAPIKKSLPNFRFIIGHHRPRMISRVPLAIEVKFRESGRSLKFVNGDEDFPDKVKTILSEAWAFLLDRHMTIKNLTHFGLENLKQLRFCILAECNEMQSIVEVDEKSFWMQFLTIFYMKNLRSIISRPILGRPVFSELKLLALHTCPELSTMFTMDFLHSLVNLEELIVEDCPKVRSIISCPSSEPTTEFFLPRLRKLSLLFVPELASISNGVRIARNLEQMGIYYCPKLQSLSTSELSSEKLKVIRAETEWWEKLQWSKAEWGQEDPSHKFNEIFSPFDEDLDILTQLTPYELMTSFNTKNDSEWWWGKLQWSKAEWGQGDLYQKLSETPYELMPSFNSESD